MGDYISLHKWQIDKELYIGNKKFHLNTAGHIQLENELLKKWQSIQK